MRMGLVYVIGHASTVAVLGGAVILFQRSLPARIDNWAERAVGFTLVLLGLYVLGTLLRQKAFVRAQITSFDPDRRFPLDFVEDSQALQSRTADRRPENAGGELRPQVRLRDWRDSRPRSGNAEPVASFSARGEPWRTRSRFSWPRDVSAGLLLMNTIMTASAVGIFGASAANPKLMRFVVALTATYSLVVGAIFLFGSSALLPALGRLISHNNGLHFSFCRSQCLRPGLGLPIECLSTS